MEKKLNRREAVAALGTVSLGGLLAACGGGDGGGGGPGSGAKEVSTEEGSTVAVEPKTTSTAGAAEFDSAGSCAVTPQTTEGPYYFDVDSIRSDIREDRKGTLLELGLRVRDAGGDCKPIENAVVDIWHCDAGGVYSGFESGEGETFLRGAQVTNAEGIAQFKTVYPGAYSGRTVHIHAKVHLDKQTVLTTQVYFDQEVTDEVLQRSGYGGAADVTNDTDGIFDPALVLSTSKVTGGYRGLLTFDVERA